MIGWRCITDKTASSNDIKKIEFLKFSCVITDAGNIVIVSEAYHGINRELYNGDVRINNGFSYTNRVRRSRR
jgi:hypothetical protein